MSNDSEIDFRFLISLTAMCSERSVASGASLFLIALRETLILVDRRRNDSDTPEWGPPWIDPPGISTHSGFSGVRSVLTDDGTSSEGAAIVTATYGSIPDLRQASVNRFPPNETRC